MEGVLLTLSQDKRDIINENKSRNTNDAGNEALFDSTIKRNHAWNQALFNSTVKRFSKSCWTNKTLVTAHQCWSE